MTRFIEHENRSLDPFKRFERKYLRQTRGNPDVRGNSDRLFQAQTTVFQNGRSLVAREFFVPSGRDFTGRTKIQLGLPNIEGIPDKFAKAELEDVWQSDEHEATVRLRDYSSFSLISVRVRIGDSIYFLSVDYKPTEAKQIYMRYPDANSNFVDLENPLRELPKKYISRDSDNRICSISLSEEQKIVMLVGDKKTCFEVKLPSHFDFQQTVERTVEEGKLDENLLYHALDGYGPWDESFNRIDWASEAGVEVIRLGEVDWESLKDTV